MSLDYSYNPAVESAYIIRVDGNELSEKNAARCAESCEKVGQKYKFFSAVDGSSGEVKIPEDRYMLKVLKQVNPYMTPGEVACYMSHFMLWLHCAVIDQPIIILEHDAIMLKPYNEHPFFNMISYLGCYEQLIGKMNINPPMPPHASVNKNYRFIFRAAAYSIDPMVAKRLVSKAINTGICSAPDIFMRCDEFAIIQEAFCAYAVPGETTIKGRYYGMTEEENYEYDMLVSQQ